MASKDMCEFVWENVRSPTGEEYKITTRSSEDRSKYAIWKLEDQSGKWVKLGSAKTPDHLKQRFIYT